MGFSHIVVPNSDTLPKVDGLNYTRVKNIREALCILGLLLGLNYPAKNAIIIRQAPVAHLDRAYASGA